MEPIPSILVSSCGRGNKPLWNTMSQHSDIVALFCHGTEQIPSVNQWLAMSDQQLYDIAQSDTPRQAIQKLQHYAYVVAYRFLHTCEHASHEQAQEKNVVLHKMQESIDRIALDILQQDPKALQDYITSKEERQKGLSVLKVIRGMGCNYNCKFCLEQTDEDSMTFIQQNTAIAYDNVQELCAMLHARMAFGIKEINFSGGDPLMGDHHKLISEVQLAKELGFPQITMITNGALLNEQLIDRLVEAGLTHITISIHTKDANKYHDLVQPKNKRNVHPHIVSMIKYAAAKQGLTVRINTAVLKDYTESIAELIARSCELGVQEITINEMIKANEFSIQQYVALRDDIPGYTLTKRLARGLALYQSNDNTGPSVAICRFGDENFVQEQSKDIYLLPNGTLSQNMFETGDGIRYL